MELFLVTNEKVSLSNELKDLSRSKQENENRIALLSRIVQSSRESLEIVNEKKEELENKTEMWKSKYEISEEENHSLKQMCGCYFKFLELLKGTVNRKVEEVVGCVVNKLESLLMMKTVKLFSVRFYLEQYFR